MSEGRARLSSLTILGGPLHGQTYRLSQELEEITIGSDPSCRFRLALPGVAPFHARIVADDTGAAVYDERSPGGIFLNFEKVEGRMAMGEGDMLRLGPPQDRESVMVQLEFGGALLDAPAPASRAAEAAPSPPGPSFIAPDDDAAFIADLEGADTAFVVENDAPASVAMAPPAPPIPPAPSAPPPPAPAASVAPPPTAPPAPVPPAPPVMEEPQVLEADEFFVAAEVDVAPPPPEPPTPPPPMVSSPRPVEAPVSPSAAAYGTDDGDFALPTFDPNWSTPAPAKPPAPPPSADEFYVDEPAAPSTPGTSSSPRPGLDFADEGAPLALETGPAPAPAAPRPTPAPAPTLAPVPVAAPAAARPATPRPARRPPADEGAAPKPRAAARPRPPASSPMGRYAAMGAGGLAVLGLLGFLATRFLGGGAKIASVEPARAKIGQTITVTGGPFALDPASNEVLFGGQPGTVLEGDGTHLRVQVPEVAVAPGEDAKVSLRVRVAGKDSSLFNLTVFGGPTVIGISPGVAQTGEEVVLAGSGWGQAPTVQFGEVDAQVLQVSSSSIRVRVPEIQGGSGTAAPVVVKDGKAQSNPAPFYVGRLPLLLAAEPPSAVPGDLVTLSGRGFQREPGQNTVTLGAARALVTSAADSQLVVVAPFTALGGAGGLTLKVAGSENEAQAALTVLPASDTVDFRFAAQVFEAAPGRPHAVLATGLGPAFVLAASGGKSAAERAYEAQRKLNDAATLLKASRESDIELRNPDTAPALALVGKPETLLDVTDEDAAAYNEDWTGQKGRGGPVTRARLGQWWAAVAKDLVLMLVRGSKPENAPPLAPEARVLADIAQAAQKTGRFGVPWSVVTSLKPGQRDALGVIAYRVPATVTGPGGAVAAAVQLGLKLEGSWTGTEIEAGQRRYISAVFERGLGTISIEAAVTLSLPLLTLEARKTEARFSLQYRGGTRHYLGKWDGHTLSGTIANDAAGKEAVGTFELRPR